ncbi:ESX-1 secretion-associated protein [Mycobacterium sp. SMC-18]|uniref:ESX-1 secretion-associated protein n=1 Tax=unclassified Mycobacterium TaxID=2642494 RepID=UPI0038777AF0
MAVPSDPLKVDPIELRMTADRLDGHSSDFSTEHLKAHAAASQAALGSGLSAAALPEMLAAWEADGAHFGERFASHAEGHRGAAGAYERTDSSGAARITDTGL